MTTWEPRPWTPGAPADWYLGPGVQDRPESSGVVLRWWTGSAWGPDVAETGTRPDPPPAWRRELPHGPVTEPIALPVTTALTRR